MLYYVTIARDGDATGWWFKTSRCLVVCFEHVYINIHISLYHACIIAHISLYHACVRRYWWLCLMEILNVQGQGIYCLYCYKTTLFGWSWKRENLPGLRSPNVLKLRLPAMSLIPWPQKHNSWRNFKNPSVPSSKSWTENWRGHPKRVA